MEALEHRARGGVGTSHAGTCGKNVLGTGNSRAPKVCLRTDSTQGRRTWSQVRAGRAEGDEITEQWPDCVGTCSLPRVLAVTPRGGQAREGSGVAGHDLPFTKAPLYRNLAVRSLLRGLVPCLILQIQTSLPRTPTPHSGSGPWLSQVFTTPPGSFLFPMPPTRSQVSPSAISFHQHSFMILLIGVPRALPNAVENCFYKYV